MKRRAAPNFTSQVENPSDILHQRQITGELARSINLLSLAAGLNSGGELCEELAAQVCSIYNSSLSKISTWKIYLWTLSGGARVILERSQVFPNTA